MNYKKGIAYVLTANIISLLTSLFTGFVLPKVLSIESYAYIKEFQLYITYISVVGLGFSEGMYLRLGGLDVEKLERKEILEELKTFKIFQLLISIIAIAISLSMKNKMFVFCSIVIFPMNVSGYLRNLYQATGQFARYSKFTNINTFLTLVVNIFLAFMIKTDYYIIYIMGYIILAFIYFLLIDIETYRIFEKETKRVHYNVRYFIEDIKSGFFLMIGNFCNVIFTSIDRIFVKYLLGTVKFAYYSFSVSVENLINVFVTPISTVMYNYFCNHKEKYNVIRIKKYVLLFSVFIIILIFPVKFIVNIWLTKYKEAMSVMFLLFASQYISIMIKCVHLNLYKAEKKQNRYFKIMFVIVIISIMLNILLYKVFRNMEAIAYATLITNIIWLLIGEYEFKEYRMRKKDYMYLLCILIIFLIASYITNVIISFLTYTIIALLITSMLEKEVKNEMISEIKKYYKNKHQLS